MIFSRLVEINANEFWKSENDVNFRFCRDKCRACNEETKLFFMDGTNYWEQVEEAKDFGCTPEFVAKYKEALENGADFVLFYYG